MPVTDSAVRPATLPPFESVMGRLEFEPMLADRAGEAVPGQLDLLEPCDQMSMRFAPEILIP